MKKLATSMFITVMCVVFAVGSVFAATSYDEVFLDDGIYLATTDLLPGNRAEIYIFTEFSAHDVDWYLYDQDDNIVASGVLYPDEYIEEDFTVYDSDHEGFRLELECVGNECEAEGTLEVD